MASTNRSSRSSLADTYGPLEDVAEEPRRRSTLLTVCPFILGNEFCERLAYYGLSTNLVIYLTRVMGQDNGMAAMQVNLFEGTCYLTPLLGAWLADSLWGRYKTIIVFSVIYLLGMVLLALSAWTPLGLVPDPDLYPTGLQNAALFTSLYIVALGTGGIKPNVSAFGADQFDETDPQDRKEKTSFFNWFYFFVNIGSLLAVTCIVYIQENVSWAVGFAVPAACMALAIFVFTAGSSQYTHMPPTESPISRVFKVALAAWRAPDTLSSDAEAPLLLSSSTNSSAHGGGRYMSVVNGNGQGEGEAFSFAPVPQQGAHGGNGLDSHGSGGMMPAGGFGGMKRSTSYAWLDRAAEVRAPSGARRWSQRQVQEVKLVFRMLPIFFATIFYSTVYVQMGSFFVVQGAYMDRRLTLPGGRSFVLPAASMAVVNTLAIVMLIPVYDKLLVPLLRRLGKPITLLQRMGWGLIVCIAAMCVAAYLETVRLQLYAEGKVICDEPPEAVLGGLGHKECSTVALSVWWQTPQYLLIGLSEVFTSIGQLEFFYDQAPDVMRSCSMALQLLSVAVGSYLSGAVVLGVSGITRRADPTNQGWLPKNLNHGRLDQFFLLLGGLMVLNLFYYLWISMGYEYKAVEHARRVAVPAAKRPPRPPPTRPTPTQAVAAIAASRAHPRAAAAAMPPESPAPAVFGRSVTYMPNTPVIPAPFR